MRKTIDKISFQEGEDYLDIEYHNFGSDNKYVEISTETSNSFAITSLEQLNEIYDNIKLMLLQDEPNVENIEQFNIKLNVGEHEFDIFDVRFKMMTATSWSVNNKPYTTWWVNMITINNYLWSDWVCRIIESKKFTSKTKLLHYINSLEFQAKLNKTIIHERRNNRGI